MQKNYLSAKGSEKLDQEREQLEAKHAELRKREEHLAAQQRHVIGSVLLGAVASGDITAEALQDFLRPLVKRKKDFEILGMEIEKASQPLRPTRAKPGTDATVEASGEAEDDPEPISSDASLSPSTSLEAS